MNTKVTIAYRKNAFRGAARSRNNRCERRRRVVVHKVKKGRDGTVSQDLTNRRGRWKVRMGVRRGRYYATVAAKTVAGSNNRTIGCKRARSRRIRP